MLSTLRSRARWPASTRARAPFLFMLALSACAGNRLDPQLHSAADSTGYALHYPEALAEAERTFTADSAQAHALASELPTRVKQIKVGDDPALPLRAVDEADAAGKSEAYARAHAGDREFAVFWEQERSALGARVSAAAHKELADGNCADKDLAPSVQRALKDGLDKPLERRLRAQNEAQRTLELHKARLLPGTLAAWQRAVDDLALASHYAYVRLRDDARALERRLDEQSAVDSTLGRAIDEERTIQTDPRGGEQKASQERVVQIEKARAALAPAAERARAVQRDSEAQLARAEAEYEAALTAIREHLRALPGETVGKPTAGSAPH